MTHELPNHRVEATFVGRPPARQIARASGVTDVEVDGCLLRCVVHGSFQPLLDSMRSYAPVLIHRPALSSTYSALVGSDWNRD
jgi:hypothetical protein